MSGKGPWRASFRGWVATLKNGDKHVVSRAEFHVEIYKHLKGSWRAKLLLTGQPFSDSWKSPEIAASNVRNNFQEQLSDWVPVVLMEPEQRSLPTSSPR